MTDSCQRTLSTDWGRNFRSIGDGPSERMKSPQYNVCVFICVVSQVVSQDIESESVGSDLVGTKSDKRPNDHPSR